MKYKIYRFKNGWRYYVVYRGCYDYVLFYPKIKSFSKSICYIKFRIWWFIKRREDKFEVIFSDWKKE